MVTKKPSVPSLPAPLTIWNHTWKKRHCHHRRLMSRRVTGRCRGIKQQKIGQTKNSPQDRTTKRKKRKVLRKFACGSFWCVLSSSTTVSLESKEDLGPHLIDALVGVRESNVAALRGLVVLQDWDRLVMVLLQSLLQRVLVVVRALHQP